MRYFNVFLFEFHHFRKNISKVITYLIFVLACIYSIYNGFSLYNKQINTITHIENEQKNDINKVLGWFENDLTEQKPDWAFKYIPLYTIKNPSPLLPLGIGQAEQYSFYKKVGKWSSTFDADMMEEISNPERLVNGSIDFSFLIIFLLPILLIILTYNIGGLEKDLRFDKLITIQSRSFPKWVLFRFLFYVFLLLLTVIILIFSVVLINNVPTEFNSSIYDLILLSSLYVILFSIIFYCIIIFSDSTSSIAFKMISIWLLFCVVLPGGVHQYASLKHPTNYMTDFLDANRNDFYELVSLPAENIYKKLNDIYPNVDETLYGMQVKANNGNLNDANYNALRQTICSVANDMNKNVIVEIEEGNNLKNKFIESTYWFNPISCFLNKWNSYTATDYNSYYNFRNNIQDDIDKILTLLVLGVWDNKKVDKLSFQNYLDELKINYN